MDIIKTVIIETIIVTIVDINLTVDMATTDTVSPYNTHHYKVPY